MKTKTYIFVKCLLFVFLINCSQSTQATLPSNFNNCQVSLDQAVNQLQEIKTQNELNFEFRIVREVTTREECIDKILGTNLEQGAELQNGLLVDLVVGVKQNELSESVKTSEYDLYLLQLEEKNIQNLNLIETPSFGEASVNSIVEGSNIITYIRYDNPLNFRFLFSEAEGLVYGVDANFQKTLILDISDKVLQDREAGLHTFDFITINKKNYLSVTYTGNNSRYNFSAFEINQNLDLGEEKSLLSVELVTENTVHFGGKILQNNSEIILCLGDLNSPGNSAKFDTPWGKIFSFEKETLIENPVTSYEDSRINYIAYGLRNPWSCFFHNNNLIIPDVGNSHWEEVNILNDYGNIAEPYFFGWPWLEAFYDANYKNLPVTEEVKNNQIENAVYPDYLFPHGNDYCAIIGGTGLSNSNKWNKYFFVGDFCTGTIWAINSEDKTRVTVLNKNTIPFSITTINDSGNGTLLIGTTSGQIFELTLP
tara:strand:- start:959 stop:2401 length:1443 start_codon:yes stop_codon:yes gene_type:complete